MGHVSMMQRNTASDSEMGQALAEVLIAAERGAALTRQVLAKPKPPTTEAKPASQGQHRPPRGNETVLVVEDNLEVADMIQRLLTSLGYQVTIQPSAEAALKYLESNASSVHLVTCDMELPGIDGKEFRDRVRSLYPDLGVVVISGSSPELLEDESWLDASVPFLLKPFSLMDLAQTVRSALDQRPA